ncbi:MAG: ABC transporter ATP-binding protein [Victivallaceae bacterium]
MVLEQVSMELQPGKIVGIFGPNGSGKSTLANCLAGILRPSTGRISIDEYSICAIPAMQLAQRMSLASQEIPAGLPFSVEQVLRLGCYPHRGFWQGRMPGESEKVAQCIELTRLQHLVTRQFNELSGGEKRRVMFARAIIQTEQFLLLDEPAAYLDPQHQLELFEIIQTLAKSGIGILITSHDLFVAPLFLDIAILMHNGRIIACGPPEQALSSENINIVFKHSISIAWNHPGGIIVDLGIQAIR